MSNDDITAAAVATRIRENTVVWEGVLAGPVAQDGPTGDTPLERAVRVRDGHLRAAGSPDRQGSGVTEPAEVAADLALAADALADQVLVEGQVEQEVLDHLRVVEQEAWACRRQVTLAAYDAAAEAYRDASLPLDDLARAQVAAYATRLGAGARVLEIGTGGGRDARALEAAGVSVRRTDVAPAFVRLLREEGHDADVLDPLVDDLGDPARPTRAYDGVWAQACLHHVSRPELRTVLTRLAAATRSDGVLWLSMKEADGEEWSTHGSIDLPRSFTYWREGPLVEALTAAGWQVEVVGRATGRRGDHWLEVTARRDGTGEEQR